MTIENSNNYRKITTIDEDTGQVLVSIIIHENKQLDKLAHLLQVKPPLDKEHAQKASALLLNACIVLDEKQETTILTCDRLVNKDLSIEVPETEIDTNIASILGIANDQLMLNEYPDPEY